MDITIHPGHLHGTYRAIPSKSHAHRVLICAAFSDAPTKVFCSQTNEDIEATADCLRSLGADIRRFKYGYRVCPIKSVPTRATLNCRESGSTLRFLLPIVGALGVDATFLLAGRLPQRPLSPLWEEMERMGCRLEKPAADSLRCTGKLISGNYKIAGNVSSQYITGLLFALSLLKGNNQLEIIGKTESKPYIEITKKVLRDFGVQINNEISGNPPFRTPGEVTIEGDWSNAAFFLAAQALGSQLKISGLDTGSPQGDRVVVEILDKITRGYSEISASDIPDLVPILAVCAAKHHGATFLDIGRLRLKESDRVATVCNMLSAMGISCCATETTLTVHPGQFQGCSVDSANDHRIAMAAAIAATAACGDITIMNAECVKKSYPSFWEEFRRLGGSYEQYIRTNT